MRLFRLSIVTNPLMYISFCAFKLINVGTETLISD